MYVPHGDPTEEVVAELAERFEEGDVVVDGGNTHWDHSIRRHREPARGAPGSSTPGRVAASPSPAPATALAELMERALRSEHGMDEVEPFVEDTDKQRWGIEYAMSKEIPIPLVAQAVWGFYESRDQDRPWAKTVALLRHEYGEHPLGGQAGTTS